ncbi:MAG: hypothetical protein ACRC10_08995 [Thermoguttaceae bacterium]
MIFFGNVIILLLFVLSCFLAKTTWTVFWDVRAVLLIVLPLFVVGVVRLDETRCALSLFFRRRFVEVYGGEVERHAKTGRLFYRLTLFSVGLALLGMIYGIGLLQQTPETLGSGFAVGLLSTLYATYLAVFVFLPISLRCFSVLPQSVSPPFQTSSFLRRIRFSNLFLILSTIIAFFFARWMFTSMLMIVDPQNSTVYKVLFFCSIHPFERQPLFVPVYQYVKANWDLPTLVLILGSLYIFIKIAGPLFRRIIIPICFLIGLFWMFQGLVCMLGNMSLEYLASGFDVAFLSFEYSLIAAGFFFLRALYGQPQQIKNRLHDSCKTVKKTETVELELLESKPVESQSVESKPVTTGASTSKWGLERIEKAEQREKVGTEMVQSRRSSCLRRTLQILFLLFLLFMFWCLYDIILSVPLKYSKETTYISGPLLRDTCGLDPEKAKAIYGDRIDYIGAIEERVYPPEMTTEDNGYRRVVLALGLPRTPDGIDPVVFAERYCQKLGLDSKNLPKPTLTYPDPDNWLVEQIKKKGLTKEEEDALWSKLFEMNDSVDSVDWSSDDWSDMKEWIELNSPILDLMSEAVAHKVYVAPLWIRCAEQDIKIPGMRDRDRMFFDNHTNKRPEIVRLLALRASLRVFTGELDGAIDDLIAIQRLACAVSRGMLFDYVKVQFLFFSPVVQRVNLWANPDVQPSREQVMRYLQAKTDAFSNRGRIADVIELERLHALAYLEWSASFPMITGLDFNVVMQETNKFYDELVEEKGRGVISQEESEKTTGSASFLDWTRSRRSVKFAKNWNLPNSFLHRLKERVERWERLLEEEIQASNVEFAKRAENGE